jgi:hypothetical protein
VVVCSISLFAFGCESSAAPVEGQQLCQSSAAPVEGSASVCLKGFVSVQSPVLGGGESPAGAALPLCM